MDDTFRAGPLLLLGGRANPPLAAEIGQILGENPNSASIRNFADGEIFVRIERNARGRDVFIIQPTVAPADSMMELLLLIDAAKRASAARVTAVVPYFGYGRQDRKGPTAGGDRRKTRPQISWWRPVPTAMIGMDFHQHQIQAFFDIPVDHLYAAPVLTGYFREKKLSDLVVVAPDVGSAKMARGFANRLHAALAIIDKRRPGPNMAEVANVVGDVDGRTCLLIDDMVDTGGTLANAVVALKERGATKVFAGATHALLSGSAVEKLAAAPLEEFVVTNTIHVPEERRFEGLKILSVASLFATAIECVHENKSVSQLFELAAES